MRQSVVTVGERTVTTLQHLSEAQRWALMAAFNGSNTDWVHGNTLNSLLRRGLIRWIDNGNAYENGRGGYITTAAGRELAESLETAASA